MSAIKELIKDIDNLQPIPAIVNQIISCIEDPKSSTNDVADIIVFDPMITANVLRTVNSAFFGPPSQIESIHDAVNLLGLDSIVDIVLLKSSVKALSTSQTGYGLHEGELWKQAVSSALVAREIAISKKLKTTQLVFTAALLKDIGKVILDRFVSDSFEKIINLVQNKKYSFREAENKVIGIDHAKLGGIVAKMWDFTPKMINIISNHHMGKKDENYNIETNIVYVADTVCMMMGIGVGEDGLAYRFHADALKKLDITDMDLQIIIAGFADQMKKVEDLISVV